MKQQAKKNVSILLSVLLAVLVPLFAPFSAIAAEEDTQNTVTYIKRVWEFGTGIVTATEEPLTEPAKAFPGTLDSGWYVIGSDQTVSDRVTIPSGSTVNLLLCDGATLTCSEGIGVSVGATLNIYGQKQNTGVLTANAETYYAAIGGDDESGHGEINIYGGDITANGGKYAAAIGTGDQAEGPFGLIAIYGGKVTATGGSEGAGIGGGNESRGGSIRICGGEITATGGKLAAGIGGGDDRGPSFIYIYGGKIDATGGEYAAGVGEGESASEASNTGEIHIFGCEKLTAHGGKLAAGIGGGTDSNTRSKIYIEGGTVRAYGGGLNDCGGAGIGAGTYTGVHYINMHGGDFDGIIDISGGSVYAISTGYSSYGGAGIGAGLGGNMTGQITISGGDVTANGKFGGAAIGAGAEAFSDAGGECEGTISILGGTVTLTADISDWDETDRPAMIGHGYDGDEQGTLVLGDRMTVRLGADAAALTDQRENTCRQGSAATLRITPCTHKNADYAAITETTHETHCRNCKYVATEEHVFLFGSCDCGAEGYNVFFMDGDEIYDLCVVSGSGKTADRPTDPEKAGLVFENWYPDDAEGYETPFDFTQPVTKDVILKAHWMAKVTVCAFDVTEAKVLQGGKVRIDTLDGNFCDNVNALVEPGDYVSFTAMADEGYEFRGWALGNLDELVPSASFGTNIARSAEIVAVFEKHAHRYGWPDWEWAEDHSSAAATFVCACGDEQTVEAVIAEEEISPADSENDRVVAD